MLMILRPSSTSTSTGTSVKSAISSSELISGAVYLVNQSDGRLAELIHGRNDLGVGLITALINDQIGEFGCDVDRRSFHRAALHGPASAGTWNADRRQRGFGAQLIIAVSDRDQRLGVANSRHRKLAHNRLVPVRELR